jgi:hypothetical protein
VAIMAPIYVASSMARAREHPEASIMHYFRTLRDMYNAPQGLEMAHLPRLQELQERLRQMTYDQVLDTIAIFGDPAYCIERLHWLKETLGIHQFICWFNTGGKIPHQQVMQSMRLFAEQVMPYVE